MDTLLTLFDTRVQMAGLNAYLRAVLLTAGFLLLAMVIERLAGTLLRRLASRWDAGFARELAQRFRRPVFITVALLGLGLATLSLGLTPRTEGLTLALLKTVLVFSWLGFGLRLSGMLLEMLGRRTPVPSIAQPSTAPLLRNLLLVLLVLVAAYAILLAWDINVTGLVASAGIIGLALSFAAQDTLGNLFAGIAILTDKPYQLGDYIVLDTGERGQVTHIGLRSTRLLTRDDVEVSIPNGIMGRAKIVNESGGPHVRYRLRVPVGVAYGSDIDRVMALLTEVAANHGSVCDTPEPRVRLRTFGESSLDFELLVWISEPSLRGLVHHELNCEIYRRFASEGITIPFPQRDVHLHAALPGTQAQDQ